MSLERDAVAWWSACSKRRARCDLPKMAARQCPDGRQWWKFPTDQSGFLSDLTREYTDLVAVLEVPDGLRGTQRQPTHALPRHAANCDHDHQRRNVAELGGPTRPLQLLCKACPLRDSDVAPSCAFYWAFATASVGSSPLF